MILTRLLVSSISNAFSFAGAKAFVMKVLTFGSQRMISTFSLFNSRTIFLTRCPRSPTQAPTSPGKNDLGAMDALFHRFDIATDSFTDLVLFGWHTLAVRQQRLIFHQ